MPLFEIRGSEELVPFRQLRGGADLYESEIEQLLWTNTEELTGESLFRVARQPVLAGGGRPDIVAFDRTASVVVIEVKRDMDRGQLAQCLEYAGWARTTNLDELAGMYHLGPDAFFKDWSDFMESSTPVRVSKTPRLLLVARDFHGHTESAFGYLIENGVPVRLIRISMYEDEQGRRFVDVEGEHEPEFVGPAPKPPTEPTKIDGRPVRLPDLLEAGLLSVGEKLVWTRPRMGQTYYATVTDDARLRLDDGRVFSSPSRAGMEAANVPSYDGWWAWRQEKPGGLLLRELRTQLVERHQQSSGN